MCRVRGEIQVMWSAVGPRVQAQTHRTGIVDLDDHLVLLGSGNVNLLDFGVGLSQISIIIMQRRR